MTKEEAVLELKNTCRCQNYEYACGGWDCSGCEYKMAIEALEKQEKFKHIIFQIGETLVDESKSHISSAEAVSKIRKILRETNSI